MDNTKILTAVQELSSNKVKLKWIDFIKKKYRRYL